MNETIPPTRAPRPASGRLAALLERLGMDESVLRERHIYMRGQGGRVKFLALGPGRQITLLMFAIIFGSWVGYASVQTLFGTGIAAIKARQLQEIQANYEDQIGEMRSSYNRLSDKNRLTQNWFIDAIERMEKRHSQLLRLLEKRAALSGSLQAMRKQADANAVRYRRNTARTQLIAKTRTARYEDVTHLPPGEKPQLNLVALDAQSASRSDEQSAQLLTDAFPGDAVERVNRLSENQKQLANRLETLLDHTIQTMQDAITTMEIGEQEEIVRRLAPEARTLAQIANQSAQGGPYIPAQNFEEARKISPIAPATTAQALDEQLTRIDRNLDDLNALSAAFTKMPLSLPLYGAYVTSGFGIRRDPITKKNAMHVGMDFAAKPTTPIFATLGGRVVRAGYRGHYGLMVEIDHGKGFRTRYAHLDTMEVARGQRVDFQQSVGTIGSTGRSTGTHLHYEIWYDGEVLDPKKFLQQGRHIFALPSF